MFPTALQRRSNGRARPRARCDLGLPVVLAPFGRRGSTCSCAMPPFG